MAVLGVSQNRTETSRGFQERLSPWRLSETNGYSNSVAIGEPVRIG